jgi:DNA-binding GntR family transcriptional regulator
MLEQIFHQKLKYGQKISEEEISEHLNVSRTPIREALRRLESQGLVEIVPKRFVQVITLNDKDIADLAIVRLNQSVLAAQLAVFHGSNSDFKKLSEIDFECDKAIENHDIYTKLKMDAEFHRAFTAIGKNPILSKIQNEIFLKVCLFQSIKYMDETKIDFSKIQNHKIIIDALYTRDLNNVITTVVQHLSKFYNLSYDNYLIPVSIFDSHASKLPNQYKKITI